MIVVITGEAEADLTTIADFIALDNPRRAASFVSELIAACHSLADMPRAYPLVPRYENAGIRRCVHVAYLIFCRIGAASIDVLHILHGAQDYESILFPTDP